jgi:ketosteroid isomerase-like protein
MGINENKQLVIDFYEAGAGGDMETCLDLLSDDVTWTNIGTTQFSGTFSGKQALMEQLLGPLFGQLKRGISSRIERLTAEGNIVVA